MTTEISFEDKLIISHSRKIYRLEEELLLVKSKQATAEKELEQCRKYFDEICTVVGFQGHPANLKDVIINRIRTTLK